MSDINYQGLFPRDRPFEKMKVIRQALEESMKALESAGIEEACLESEILLRHVLGLSKAELHARIDDPLSADQSQALNHLLQRRLTHEPSAYITGHKEFYGIDFYVNRATLIPRPETEILVEQALELLRYNPTARIIDVGTGCGAIAIALAIHLPQAMVCATDISASALRVAASNCFRNDVPNRVHLIQADLLGSILGPFDLIVANLPYVSDMEMRDLSKEIRLFEPNHALAGGPDGLGLISRLLPQAKDRVRSGGAILLEIGQTQRRAAIHQVRQYFPGAPIKAIPDLSQKDRGILVKV
ncbi:MAG: peptide chain release factor N(5)-glutamine methyltransferase [Dehalococcoidia bacterium]|nr:peptide chain release factor N(5)-glutamine methyltransferase [Dehalococcoidia bacterium]